MSTASPELGPATRAWVDQIDAAAAEMEPEFWRINRALRDVDPERGWRTRHPDPHSPIGREVAARALTAATGCKPCAHLLAASGGLPNYTMLAARRAVCRACLASVVAPPAAEDDCCDWCRARGISRFTPIALQIGPALLIGDACEQCAAGLAIVTAAEEEKC